MCDGNSRSRDIDLVQKIVCIFSTMKAEEMNGIDLTGWGFGAMGNDFETIVTSGTSLFLRSLYLMIKVHVGSYWMARILSCRVDEMKYR